MSRWDAHLSTLVERRYPALVAYARMLTGGDLPAAEDIVQDAIVKSFARTRGFADQHHAENYVRRAIMSAFIDTHRSRSRLMRAYSRSVERDAVQGPETAVGAATDVERALATLAPRERACAVLRFYDDLTVAQIATHLGIADGTVKRYLSDASAKLAAILGADASSPDFDAADFDAADREVVTVSPHRKELS